METMVWVYVDLQGTSVLMGRLWARIRKEKETATFEYDAGWLTREDRFALEPLLQVGTGPYHTQPDKALFGALTDSAPDRWGRILMQRAERRRAELAGTAPRALREIDYLLQVNDEARQGALRFSLREGGPFVAEGGVKVPPLVDLPRLLSAADRVTDGSEDDEDMRLLLAPGSSLGGARPKASVRDNEGQLSIAKFPRKGDENDTVLWEAVSLTLAEKAGISVPMWRIEHIAGKPVLLLRRFDRTGAARVPFLSGMSMLGARDGETRSYLELADILGRHGAASVEDKRALWRRIVFNILISNTDDHLRNHGFLYANHQGWRLSPAFDMNPVPGYVGSRVLSMAIDLDERIASLELAMSVSEYFKLDAKEARAVAREVGCATTTWRETALELGLKSAEIVRMSSAFEHEDLQKALAA